MKLWKANKVQVRQILQKALKHCQYCLTEDLWTSKSGRGYMAVTIHYIDNDWKLKSTIIYFYHIQYPHTAKELAEKLLDGIVKMSPSLLTGMWMLTTDNASTNQAMIRELNNGILEQYIKHHLGK
jgi:hypothetical protein